MKQFLVQKDTGDYWFMNYSSSGVSWVPTDNGFLDQTGSTTPNAPPAAPTAGPALGAGRNASSAIAGISAISQVMQSAAMAGLWWEDRQRRLLDEAKQEEMRRIAWLADMTARWGEVHRSGDHLNLRVTEHLAREAKETMNVLLSNKRVSIPQSILCELGAIQDALGSFRSLILTQFEELAASDTIDLSGAVREALPGRKLNMDFIRALGIDPALELEHSVKAKAAGGFDQEFSGVLVHAAGFNDRVFPNTLPVIREPLEAPKTHGLWDHLAALVSGALPHLPAEDVKPESLERLTTFRELTLLPAEVLRVRALNSAWLATSTIVAESLGIDVAVRVGSQGVRVELESAPTRLELSGPGAGPK